MNQYQEIKETGVLFYSTSDQYSYISLCLADGLNQLGIPIFSNSIDYEEKLVSEFKFRNIKNTNNFEFSNLGEPKYIVIDLSFYSFEAGIVNLDLPPNKIAFALSMSDSISSIVLKNDIPFFCTHCNDFLELKGLRIPWAFGLSSNMIKSSSSNITRIDSREKTIVYNFRPSTSQSVRECLDLILVPQLEKYFSLDSKIINQGRWSEDNFERLKKSFGCLAYGGAFTQNLIENPFFADMEQLANLYKEISFLKRTIIGRWDSWRFWESLAAGCLTFHLDFEKYGFNLPIMPTNWEHYIGLNLEDIKGDIERLMDERDRLPEIAISGRTWALEHYSPVAVAKRFLSFLEEYT
jgi:hypothetical protein